MSTFETDFEVLKDEAGNVNGFSLIAQPQTEAEVFCETFPKALMQHKADINFEGEEIVFDHPTCRYQGRCAHKMDNAEGASLQEFLCGEQKKKLERAGFLTSGFKIVQE